MSLRLTRRAGSPYWWITGTIEGQRIRESTGRECPEQAAEKLAVRSAEIYRSALHGAPARVARFAEAALAYLEDQPRTESTKARVNRLLIEMGPNASCKDVTQERLELAAKHLLRPGHKPATRLREIVSPARAVLTFAAWRGWCPPPQLRVTVKQSSRTEWLTPGQVDAIISTAPSHLTPLVAFLIGTGARMGEAIRLEWTDVDLKHARARLRETKNGDDRNVDLPPRTVAALAAMAGRSGRVFRNTLGNPYRDTRETDGGGQVREPWARMCARAGLPGKYVMVKRVDRERPSERFRPVHTPHSARHTWATWHYAEHKDVLRLRVEGGWKDVSLVVRYAHLAPPTMRDEIVAWRTNLTAIVEVKQNVAV